MTRKAAPPPVCAIDRAPVNFASLFDSLPDPIAVCDEEGLVLASNHAAREFLGFDDDATVRLDLRTRETVRQIRLVSALDAHEFFLSDIGVTGARRTHASASLYPVEPSGYRVTFSSERGESALNPIIDQLDAIVVVCDARRRILVSNRTFETLVGGDGVAGRDVVEFFEGAGAGTLRSTVAAVMAGNEAGCFEAHLTNARHEPVRLRVQVAATPSRDGAGAAGFIVTGQQSELSLVELEERMTRAEQLLNVGELATGVAHELKNPLTSILNYADYLLRKYQDSFFEDRDSERLRRIIEGVERIDNFVRDLVVLARPTETSMQRVELHSVIRESGLMCDVALRQSKTTLRVDLDPRSPAVIGSPHQLKQVFVNLLVNAAKAMPEGGGTITVATRIHAGAVSCHVTDDAEGMSDETLARIFEPFFTTREGRDGTGLGLALVHTIVRRHHGEVAVDSELGRGTTFTIRLPLAGE